MEHKERLIPRHILRNYAIPLTYLPGGRGDALRHLRSAISSEKRRQRHSQLGRKMYFIHCHSTALFSVDWFSVVCDGLPEFTLIYHHLPMSTALPCNRWHRKPGTVGIRSGNLLVHGFSLREAFCKLLCTSSFCRLTVEACSGSPSYHETLWCLWSRRSTLFGDGVHGGWEGIFSPKAQPAKECIL